MNSRIVIHLSKLDSNLEAINRRLKPGVKKMAVIKDNAYGHGMVEVAMHIAPKVEWFCVARASEGKLLRDQGITNPILVFEAPTEETAQMYVDFNLTATLSDISVLGLLKNDTKFHINIDTGMHRLGILPDDIQQLKMELKKYPGKKCTGIYTHYYKADDPGNPEVSRQLALFRSIRSEFPSEWMTHTANTGGIFHYRDLDLQFDAVRPGVCLYGYGAGEIDVPDLEPILDFTSFLMQVKKIKKGDSASYGSKWHSSENGYIGIVPTGYSDGIPRILTNKIEFEIEGERFSQVGIISMDYSIVFLRDRKFSSGTTVYLLRQKELSVKAWAKHALTIPYEITTGLKERIPRIYV
ncbi:MAG: alanine racemase [Balneola sp.]|nr:MAG: alanine racemase [Balneola sp.]